MVDDCKDFAVELEAKATVAVDGIATLSTGYTQSGLYSFSMVEVSSLEDTQIGVWSEDGSFTVYYDVSGFVYDNGEQRLTKKAAIGDLVTVVIRKETVVFLLNGEHL